MPIYFKVKDRGTIYWCSSQEGMSMVDTSIVTEAYRIINGEKVPCLDEFIALCNSAASNV